MVTRLKPDSSLWECIEHANQVAGQVLRSHLGAYTPEDVVGIFIQKQVSRGKDQAAIREMLSSPRLYQYLQNVKTDCYRRENAAKRTSGRAASFEEVESICGGPAQDNPEAALIRKESETEAKNVLEKLFEGLRLSETQLEILELDRRGFTTPEIAARLRTSVDVIYSRRSEAMRRLARKARRLLGKPQRSRE